MKTEGMHTRERRQNLARQDEKVRQVGNALTAKTLLDHKSAQKRKPRKSLPTSEAIVLIPPFEEKPASKKTDSRLITFQLSAPLAAHVSIAGTFNDWDSNGMPLTKESNGEWQLRTMLRPGEYEYRFIVDGTWQEDPGATHHVTNPFGTRNSVVRVA